MDSTAPAERPIPHYDFRALVRQKAEPFPTVVCLCGSTRFKDEFLVAAKRLTLEGKIVLSVGWFSHVDDEKPTDEQKAALDRLHLRKIDLADEVYVLNVGGYVGESTAREIAYAYHGFKPVAYLEPPEGSRADDQAA